MNTETISSWRCYSGAEYDTPVEIPCNVIAGGYLIDDSGDPIHEDHPALAAEIQRRGKSLYRDHGYGEGRDGVPVVGCRHCAQCGQSMRFEDDEEFGAVWLCVNPNCTYDK